VDAFELEQRDSPGEELASIVPAHVHIATHYLELGVTFNGGTLVKDR